MLRKGMSASFTAAEGERAVIAKISTSSVDRDGEVLVPAGASWKNYLKNPIVLYQHDGHSLPVAKATNLTRDANSITAKLVFAKRPDNHPADAEWLPDTLLALYQQGVMNGFSVGFMPTETPRIATQKDLETYGPNVKRIFHRWDLLEFSAVTIPANQDAVAVAVSKSMKPLREIFGISPKLKTFAFVIPSLADSIESELARHLHKAQGYVYEVDTL